MNLRPFDLVLNHGALPPAGGLVKRRLAVRALIVRDGRLLMVHSRVQGDWKFPGGGVEPLETTSAALEREVAEETGYRTAGPQTPAGRVVERAPGRDVPGSRFEMESLYFWTQVDDEPGPLALEDYERHLGFTPGWVSIDDALGTNRALARSGRRPLPSWLEREMRVLELLARADL
jgi:8-oxo-dGTP diphosphatase